MRIKFDEGWKVIPKNAISKIESNIQMQIKLNLVFLAQDTYHRDLPENEQKLKDCAAWKDKEKGNIAVMGAAVVQMNEKEEVFLEEVLAYTTGWLSSTRAELL
ncbi:44780_t:CDS:2, partial [Gigaspora margarita]